MNEKDLNIEYICEKTLLDKDDELVPIILDLIKDSYKAGLCQAEFDNTMNLIEENEELKKINEEHKKLNGDLRKENQEIRLDQTKKVFHVLTHVLLNGGCTYRYLIYDLLDFKPKNYSDLIEGMNIVNAIATLEELKKQVEDLFSENRNLRKKLENCMTFEDYKYTLNKKIKLETQQKEFIKYLEDEIKINTPKARWKHYNEDGFNDYDVENGYGVLMRPVYMTLKEILQKYKSIIGGNKDEK